MTTRANDGDAADVAGWAEALWARPMKVVRPNAATSQGGHRFEGERKGRWSACMVPLEHTDLAGWGGKFFHEDPRALGKPTGTTLE